MVELTTLDSAFKFDIRYASTNNFLASRFYGQPRAFMQRPAALALVKVQKSLAKAGYGLLIYEAYRPWYLTKLFWDAVPEAMHQFVADPELGSQHNRGCAVDLTLYDLKTGQVVEMPSIYDEFTERAHAEYPGGTDQQRRMRALLRQQMEAQGFSVYEFEWWHFDYRDWKFYAIQNMRFEDIGKTETDVPK